MTGQSHIQAAPCGDRIYCNDCGLCNSSHPLTSHFPFPSCCSLLSSLFMPSIMLPSSLPPASPPPCLHLSAGMPRGSIRSSSLRPSCHSRPSLPLMSHNRASTCHCFCRGRGFVPEVTDSCREGGARQTECLNIMLTSHPAG